MKKGSFEFTVMTYFGIAILIYIMYKIGVCLYYKMYHLVGHTTMMIMITTMIIAGIAATLVWLRRNFGMYS